MRATVDDPQNVLINILALFNQVFELNIGRRLLKARKKKFLEIRGGPLPLGGRSDGRGCRRREIGLPAPNG